MKPNLNTFILIAGFIAVIWFLRSCGSQNVNLDPVKSETVLRYDTTIHLVHTHKIYYKPAANADTSQFIEIIPEGNDPSQPLTFSDTIVDSNISGVYSGVLWQNRLFNPEFKYQITRPTQYITHVRPDPRGKLSLGLFAGYSDAPFIGGLAMYSDRRDRSILVGYGTGKTVLIGMGWKISFRKR